jgi:ABC-2 type transport system ATP-binding protein
MASLMGAAVQIKNLFFQYRGRVPLFQTLNLDIGEGERFGLFGPNGAGKTTLMHLLTGLLSYPQGSIQLFGHRVHPRSKPIKKLLGLVPQDLSFYPELSPEENLYFFGALSGMSSRQIGSRSRDLLAMLGLEPFRKKPLKHFSGGMKRRMNLAIGVIGEPRILFLDEPTVGVDVQSRHAIVDFLRELNEKKGTTLVYTSHQLGEAEELCRRIALMDEGRIIAHDQLDNLLRTHRQEGLEGLFISLTGKALRD